MGNSIYYELAELVIRAVVLVLAGIIIPAVKEWVDTKTENAKMEQVREAARIAVYAAEQLYNTAKKADPDGSERRKLVRTAINRAAIKVGIALSNEEIDHMMEAAVKELNIIAHGFDMTPYIPAEEVEE